MENKYPIFVVGAFIINQDNKLFLRTSPSISDRFTCINGKVEWGKTIEETLRSHIKSKTNLDVIRFDLLGLTDGLNIDNGKGEFINMIFADYKVTVNDKEFKTDNPERKHKWLSLAEWLAMSEDKFGPYIYDMIKKL